MKTSWMKKWWMLGALLGACTQQAEPTDDGVLPEPEPVSSQVALQSFATANACQDLEQYIEDTAVAQMKSQILGSIDGYYYGGFGRGLEFDSATGAPTAGAAEKNSAPANYTSTNTQVQGVDEADFVKNDGTRIFALSGETLYASQSWPAADLGLKGKLKIEGYPTAMFLDGSRVVVFSNIYRWYPLNHTGDAACASVDGLTCGYSYSNTVKVTVVDASDMSQMRVTHEYVLPGSYLDGRKVGSSVRLVLTDGFNFPEGMQWWANYDCRSHAWDSAVCRSIRKAALLPLIPANERLIRAQKLTDWLPPAKVRIGGAGMPEQILEHDCRDFSRVNAPTQLGTVSVITLNLDRPSTLGRASIIAQWGQIYASARSLYIANPHWFWLPRSNQTDATYLHKFDISNPDRAIYEASGVVDGMINDQFSMDENSKGFFRVATTITRREPDPQHPEWWWGRTVQTNRVTVFEEKGRALAVVGKTGEFAKDERIQSARFIEDRGFVVTFRQVDPFFALDLKDPTKPTLLGELKVPGFSSYMQPLDENHLITIGTYLPEPDAQGRVDWQDRTIQLSIFDVTDLKNPKQVHNTKVGNAYSWSEAQSDHKAFNYFPSKKTLAIPYYSWDWSHAGRWDTNEYWSSFTSDLRVFDVDLQKGITLRGALSMRDLYQVERHGNWTYYWTPAVRRSVQADDTEGNAYVYAISDVGIRVAPLDALYRPLATVSFTRYGK